MRNIIVNLSVAMLLTVGCNQNKAADTHQSSSQTATSNKASDSYHTANYDLVLEAPSGLTQGKDATFRVVLKTKGDFHINQEFPHRFQCDDSSKQVVYAKKVLGKKDGKFSKTEAVIPVKFSVAKPGSVKVGGVYRFSVCSEARCLMEKKTLVKTVEVH